MLANAEASGSGAPLPWFWIHCSTSVTLGAIAPSKAVEHLDQPCREQGVALETTLAAEEVQLHQQFIDHPPVERRDHMGEGAVEGAFAV
jgi:hypothetical protein